LSTTKLNNIVDKIWTVCYTEHVNFNKGYSDKFRSENVKNYKWYSPPDDSPIEVAHAIISEVTYPSILRS
jgi:hypothetical protein